MSAVTSHAHTGSSAAAPAAAALAPVAGTGGGTGGGDAAYGAGSAAPNPLALLAKMDVLAAGEVYVSQHGGTLRNRLFRRSVLRRYAEARGRVVLLRLEAGGPVHDLFSPVGAAVSVADTVVTKRGSVVHNVTIARGGQSVLMRFGSETQAERWADVLGKMGASRVPRLADFDVISPIGEGASGKVFLVRDRKTGRKLALKCMNKSVSALATGGPDARHAIDERVTHEVMNGSEYIVALRHAFQTRSKLYLATEFCDGGDVYNFVDWCGGGVSEEHARLIAAQVALGLKKLHDRNIVFRDLKPENALITGDGRVRLADFGLCKHLDAPSALTETVCGTFSYAAAEILSGDGYGRAVDMWAFGTFLYHIMIGRPPRVSASVHEARAAIFESREPIIWYSDVMSEEAMSLVTGLIDLDPATRLGCGPGGVAGLFEHPFFRGIKWADLAAGRIPTDIRDALPPPELGDLRNFNQEEWEGMVMDSDRDEPAYSESSLWPLRNLVTNPLPADFVVSYSYSAEPAATGDRHFT
jgi:serine/threonine protein kinase